MSGMYGQGGDDSRGGGYGGRSGGAIYGGGRGYGGNSQSRGGGGGDRGGSGRSGGDRGGRGSGRDGDWRCTSQGCGNLNFARRVECNKCGAPSPSGGDNDGARSGGGYDRGSGGGGGYGGRNHGGNRSGGGRDASYGGGGGGGNQGRDDVGYGHTPPPVQPSSYGGASAGNYPPPSNPNPNPYGVPPSYGVDNAVPPPTVYTGGPNSYPPSYGAPPSYGGDGAAGRGPQGGYDGGYAGAGARTSGGGGGTYGGSPAEVPAKVKQCDGNCDDNCDNSRIYISNLPPNVTTEELKDLFGGIGQIARIRQKRGYKDQWPHNIKIYTDDNGKNKGDGVLSYEDPSAAHSAGGFFDNYELNGYKIHVAMAEKSAPRPPTSFGGGGGRGGYGGGGDRRRDNYRDGGGSGPDRHSYGGNRSRPY